MVSRFGPPEVLRLVDLPTPSPGDGQLRVTVTAAGVGWLDARIRAGGAPPEFALAPPYVPGSGVAGVVTAVGPTVSEQWLGARVVTHPAGGLYGGGYADTVIADREDAVVVPDGLEPRHALAVLDDGGTALALLERTPVHAGEHVVVAPGVGGLGSLLVQLARAEGANVVAAVRGGDKMEIARRLGVDAVDYGAPDWPADLLARTGGRGPDVAFDGLGGAVGATLLGLLGDGGRFSGYGMSSGAPTVIEDADRRRLTVADMTQLPEFWPDAPRRVRRVLGEAAAGRLTPIIGRTYPLAEAAAAHVDIEARRFVGKIMLLP
ncbi:zinc-binding dehydrogenase [Pseudonocardia acaciae]|uniref:zinc-binding dehydrogenase n=1 Tax=Pseudonocardia acaciae TaxID=551276 RepID=UPI000B08239C|nr:zinc-binding dehydrogenase [Pseudonocardia acaciae]